MANSRNDNSSAQVAHGHYSGSGRWWRPRRKPGDIVRLVGSAARFGAIGLVLAVDSTDRTYLVLTRESGERWFLGHQLRRASREDLRFPDGQSGDGGGPGDP